MANGTVVLYFSRFGKPLQTHHKVVLDVGARLSRNSRAMSLGGTTMRHVTTGLVHGFRRASARDRVTGYTVFSSRDARVAARRMLARGPIRVKKPHSERARCRARKGHCGREVAYGLVLEENLRPRLSHG
jgi:hypothetical protein